MSRAIDVESLVGADMEAHRITNLWVKWNGQRAKWLQEKAELQKYVYATDTTTTTNSKLPWSNSTTMPKLCQIYDNLLANYNGAIFPRDDFFKFIPGSDDDNKKKKVDAVQAYMKSKVQASGSVGVLYQLIADWVLYGNCFSTIDYVRNYTELESGEEVKGYVGPRIQRISPFDIVFDPTVSHFSDSPKIIRSLIGVEEIMNYNGDLFERMMDNRQAVVDSSSQKKDTAYVADGFGSLRNYYESPYAEILTFYGDVFDRKTRTLRKGRVIKVVDRAYILSDDPFPSWFGKDAIFHTGWRKRPDNLWGMGPLDNLVGMQYRIDHLQNLKADIWDLTAGPMIKIRGDIDEFNIGPLERVYVGTDGDFDFVTPPAVALAAEQEIGILESKMEEFAGAPKMAMGFRTPGEKTAFEVQTLDNAANRIFNNKAKQWEREFLEDNLKFFFESAKREMDEVEEVPTVVDDLALLTFQEITKEDITANGVFRAMGSRIFEEKARRAQTLNTMLGVKAQMPDVGVHWSGKELAKILAEELDESGVYLPNIQVRETIETQERAQDEQVNAEERSQLKTENGF